MNISLGQLKIKLTSQERKRIPGQKEMLCKDSDMCGVCLMLSLRPHGFHSVSDFRKT
ncbi:hypothetical protein ACRRTK_010903 [Alexandromys fortis]